MVTEMRNARHLFWLSPVLLAISGLQSASAHCNMSPDLSAVVAEFDSIGTSRIDALLRFGELHDLCFGIEYVDTRLLTEPTDFHIRSMSIRQSIRSILGQERLIAIGVSNGIITISREQPPGEKKSIFDYVLPRFETRRASVQEISTALHMQLVVDLNPQATGFAGSYPAGDLKDEVGPISESNRSIRYLLDELVSLSKGGAWVARVRLRPGEDLKVAEGRRVWTVVEYGLTKTGYASILNSVARDLGPDPPAQPY